MTDPIISLDPDTVKFYIIFVYFKILKFVWRLNESVSGTMKLYIYKWLI